MRRDMSPGRWRRGKSLRFERARADNARMSSLSPRALRRARRDERGQALVEFALVAPLFLMLVIGIIQFAVALNFWFDMQRLANQGARAATVNCGAESATQPANLCLTSGGTANLERSLREQVLSRGNDSRKPGGVEICYVPPDTSVGTPPTATVGDAVRVTVHDRYRLQAIVGLAKIDLRARATMRLEQTPTAAAGMPDPLLPANYVLTSHTGSAACQL
jgi:Flp pilus assembly pilin Flp